MPDPAKVAEAVAWLRRNAGHYAAEAEQPDQHGLADWMRTLSGRFREAAELIEALQAEVERRTNP